MLRLSRYSPFGYLCIATLYLYFLLSKNSHLCHNHFYSLIFINFIFLINLAPYHLACFFSTM
ncbi:hypothetical protein FNI18_10445 [Salmonella enterica subsp. salamae]|nr:hypothetical protein [Salmonella enterica subsp. salamae]